MTSMEIGQIQAGPWVIHLIHLPALLRKKVFLEPGVLAVADKARKERTRAVFDTSSNAAHLAPSILCPLHVVVWPVHAGPGPSGAPHLSSFEQLVAEKQVRRDA